MSPAPRFLCDSHLDKLGRRLRLLGFDTRLARDATGADPGDRALADLAVSEGRLLLTRDRGLRERMGAGLALDLPQAPVDMQLRDLVHRLGLAPEARPFSRCTCCNTPIEPAAPASVRGRVPQAVLERQPCFWRCPGCGRVYWEGSHYRRMGVLVDAVLAGAAEGG